jgi:hypothetical protein
MTFDPDTDSVADQFLKTYREVVTPPVLPRYRPGDEFGIRLLGKRHRSMIVESVDGATLHLRPRTWRDLPRTLIARIGRIASRATPRALNRAGRR